MPVAVDVGHLLYELCTKLGYCLPPDEQRRLIEQPPMDPERFTEEVFRAEGIEPALVRRREHQAVLALVTRYFAEAL